MTDQTQKSPQNRIPEGLRWYPLDPEVEPLGRDGTGREEIHLVPVTVSTRLGSWGPRGNPTRLLTRCPHPWGEGPLSWGHRCPLRPSPAPL